MSSDGADVSLPPTPEHMLAPVDLVPATRRPLLIIVDSDRAAAFVRLQELSLGTLPLLLLKPQSPPDLVRRASSVRLFPSKSPRILHSPSLAPSAGGSRSFCLLSHLRETDQRDE